MSGGSACSKIYLLEILLREAGMPPLCYYIYINAVFRAVQIACGNAAGLCRGMEVQFGDIRYIEV